MVVLKIKDVNQTLYQDVLNSNIHVNFPRKEQPVTYSS